MAIDGVFDTSKSPVTLPESVSGAIFNKAREASVLARLSKAEPLTLGTNTRTFYTGGIEVGKTDELGAKPVSEPKFDKVSITPHKVATIVPVSTEALMTDRIGMYRTITDEMSKAVARYLDTLGIHGKDRFTGENISGQTSIVGGNSTKITLTDGDYKAGLLAAVGAAAGTRGSRPNGIAVDGSAHFGVLNAANEVQVGLPNLSSDVMSVAGLPAVVSDNVSWVSGETYTDDKLIVGDWSKVLWGFASDIQWAVSDEATITVGGQTISAFQHNAKFIRVEAFIGATVVDPSAFAVLQGAGE